MDKPIAEVPPPLVPEKSADWDVIEPNEEHEADIEQDGGKPELTRTASGPPYTIFSPRTKIFIIVLVSISGLISPFGAVTFYPALPLLARDLDVTPSLINIALTTYMVSLTTNLENLTL